MAHVIKVVMVAKENVVAKVNIIMKTTTTTNVDLEKTTHVARVVALVDTPPTSLIDSTMNPKVKTSEG
jgi:hypothetical protein